MNDFSSKFKYDKTIWLDSKRNLSDAIKLALFSRINENKTSYDCFLEDLKEIPEVFIKKTLCALKYKDFLHTPYWRMIAAHIKYERDMVCENCGKRFNKDMFLDIHHKDYSIHGAEHLHTNELICLCDYCHNNIHEIK